MTSVSPDISKQNPSPTSGQGQRRELLIGCGLQRTKIVKGDWSETWENLTTLDADPSAKSDVIWDLHALPLPFEANSFDEIHAYEVLEHVGRQGDYKTFFRQFSEFWRLLKPGGIFAATCPSWRSRWAWGDPSHTRILCHEQLTFLVQPEYTKQVGKTAMSDYRGVYQADFDVEASQTNDDSFIFVLRAVKPSRITPR